MLTSLPPGAGNAGRLYDIMRFPAASDRGGAPGAGRPAAPARAMQADDRFDDAPNDPLERLLGLERFGMRPGLDTIRRLTAALGDPQAAYPSIIVAGTNGKGSVAAMLDSALLAAGYRAGRYTSPHLTSITERFTAGGAEIGEAALREEADGVLGQADALVRGGGLRHPPTFFEAATAIALSWFRREAIDVAVVEVGLGGRLDATNVLTPAAGVITSIGLDHREHLGDTLEAVAAEKAGIVKPGMVVVTTETAPPAVAVIDDACRRRGARLVRAAEDTSIAVGREGPRPRIEVTTPRHRYPAFPLGLAGPHQLSNAAGAIRLLEELAGARLPVRPDAIVHGLAEVAWPGRLDLVRVPGRGAVLLDAAHNPPAAAGPGPAPSPRLPRPPPHRVRGDARQGRRRHHRAPRPLREPHRLHRAGQPARDPGPRPRGSRAGAVAGARGDHGGRPPPRARGRVARGRHGLRHRLHLSRGRASRRSSATARELEVCAVERCRLLAGSVDRPAEPRATMGGPGLARARRGRGILEGCGLRRRPRHRGPLPRPFLS